jgi:PAS domain-containing protein
MRASSAEAVCVFAAPPLVSLAAVATEVMFSATWRPPCAASVALRAVRLRTSKLPLRDLQGNVIGVLGTYEDTTERKQAEE